VQQTAVTRGGGFESPCMKQERCQRHSLGLTSTRAHSNASWLSVNLSDIIWCANDIRLLRNASSDSSNTTNTQQWHRLTSHQPRHQCTVTGTNNSLSSCPTDLVYCTNLQLGRVTQSQIFNIFGAGSFTGEMSFLPPNQQCQSTQRNQVKIRILNCI